MRNGIAHLGPRVVEVLGWTLIAAAAVADSYLAGRTLWEFWAHQIARLLGGS